MYVLAMLLLSTIGVFVHEAGVDPMTAVFFRCAIGAAALLAYCSWQGLLVREHATARNVKLAVLSGLLMLVNWVTFFKALQLIGIALATIVFHVQPFLVLLLSALLLRERIALAKLAWVVLGIGGLVLACGVGAGAPGEGYLLGIALTLTGALAYAGVTLTTRAMRATPPHLTALVHCLVGTIAMAAFVHQPPAVHQLGWLAALGLLPTALAYVLIYGAVPHMKTVSIAVLTFIYPAAAVAWDVIVYGHPINMAQLSGLCLIVLASLGVSLGKI